MRTPNRVSVQSQHASYSRMRHLSYAPSGQELHEKEKFEHSFHGIRLPWYSGHVGFWRRRISTHDMHRRPREVANGFPPVCRRKTSIALDLGSSVGISAPKGKRIDDNTSTFPRPLPALRGPRAKNRGSLHIMPRNNQTSYISA